MSSGLKIGFFLFILFSSFLGGWVVSQPYSLKQATESFLGYYAKEICSCRYVLDLPLYYCIKDTFQISEPSSVKEKDKEILVSSFGKTRSARWISPKEGCRLEVPSKN